MKKIATPKAVASLIKRAYAQPTLVPASRLDKGSSKKRESLKDVPVGVALKLRELCHGNSHQLQRDTESRLADLKQSAHIRVADEIPTPQLHVQFVYFDGKFEVLDGNHRLTLWGNPGETSKVPEFVDVTIHYPATVKEYRTLYRCIDSAQAKKTNQQNMYGIFKAIGVTPISPVFKANKVVSAIRHVTGCTEEPESLLEGARSIAPELALLDSYTFSTKRKETYAGSVWAALLILLREGHDTKVVAQFALHLKVARTWANDKSVPTAVREFLAEYVQFALPGSAGNMSKVVVLVKETFAKYANDVLKANQSLAASSRTRLKLA